MQIIDKSAPVRQFALLNLGFRPFFIGAGLSSACLMLVWMFIYSGEIQLTSSLSAMQWHGHEMVYGYCLAVIAGFVLTATKNWTGQQTLRGLPLLGLVLLWLAARVCVFIGTPAALWLMAFFDLSFMLGLVLAVLFPILRTNKREQFPVVIKISMMMASNFMFYLGVLVPGFESFSSWGIYLGFYLILSLIMMMGRRVIPFFIERASATPIQLTNWKWLDLSSMFIFLAFMIVEVFMSQPLVSAVLAGVLFVLHLLRLINWYHRSIFAKPLLWVLYLGYAFIVLGFGMKVSSIWFTLSPWLSLHAFAVGGIGLITSGMMARVALGHTGRNVMQPPRLVGLLFLLIAVAAVIRVILPIILPTAYMSLVQLSQIFWIAGFGMFVAIYLPMLIKPRQDGAVE